MCTKIQHKTYQKALGHLISLTKKTGSARMSVYKCKECKRFHIGHRGIQSRGRKRW